VPFSRRAVAAKRTKLVRGRERSKNPEEGLPQKKERASRNLRGVTAKESKTPPREREESQIPTGEKKKGG